MHARVPGKDSLGKVLAFRAEGRPDVASTHSCVDMACLEGIDITSCRGQCQT